MWGSFLFINHLLAQLSRLDRSLEDLDIRNYIIILRKLMPVKKTIHRALLLKKLKARLKLSFEQVEIILKHFLDEKILFENWDNEISINVLSNPTRKAIYSAIRNSPGIYLNKLKEKLGLNSNQLLYHLGILIEFQKIMSLQIGKIKAFGINELNHKDILISFYLSRKTLKEILTTIWTNSAVNVTQICNYCENIPASTIIYNLNFLVKRKLLRIELIDQQKVYVIPPDVGQTINKQIAFCD